MSKCAFEGSFQIWHFLSKNVAKFRLHQWQPESEQESILKFENFLVANPDSKILGQKRITATTAFHEGPQFKIA